MGIVEGCSFLIQPALCRCRFFNCSFILYSTSSSLQSLLTVFRLLRGEAQKLLKLYADSFSPRFEINIFNKSKNISVCRSTKRAWCLKKGTETAKLLFFKKLYFWDLQFQYSNGDGASLDLLQRQKE